MKQKKALTTEQFELALKQIAAKLLAPESSPFDATSREWRRGEACLQAVHGEAVYEDFVTERQREWLYEGALRFMKDHARLYARFFEGEFIQL